MPPRAKLETREQREERKRQLRAEEARRRTELQDEVIATEHRGVTYLRKRHETLEFDREIPEVIEDPDLAHLEYNGWKPVERER